MTFSKEAWDRITPLYRAILDMPFNQEPVLYLVETHTVPFHWYDFGLRFDALFGIVISCGIPPHSDSVTFSNYFTFSKTYVR